MNGALFHWGAYNENYGSHLLDTTPQSPSGINDAAVVIGRTFSVPYSNVYFTPIAKGFTVPESLDIVVNFGPFPGNVAPTATLTASATSVATDVSVNFTSTASDTNGDALAYYWDFGDDTFGSNLAAQSKSWSAAGQYAVSCTVSDMKGGLSRKTIVITVGTPSVFTASGIVKDTLNNPVVGVRVHNGLTGASYRGVYTNSDGTYTIPNLASGSYTFSAAITGYTLAISGFTNPVTVSANVTGRNFTATQLLYSISGTINDNGLGVAGVVVSDGTRSVTSNSSGVFTKLL
jgi:PKD repeat protein